MVINKNNDFKYNFRELKEQMDSFLKFFAEKNKIKYKLTKDILGDRLLQFVGEEAIEVGLDHYCLSIDNENMFTLGIASCCAIFVEKEYKTFLMHISPKSQAKDIFNLLSMLSLNRNAQISIFIGPSYKASETGFDYIKLAKELEKLNNNVVITPIIGEHGNIFIFGRDIYIIEKKEENILKKENKL